MVADRHFTNRPFTVAACAVCAPDITEAVMPKVKEVVRNCPHAVLVVTNCFLGTVADVSMGSGQGVLLVLQPCRVDRSPTSTLRWVGPVRTEAQARTVCGWIASGDWSRGSLPPTLRLQANLVRSPSLN